MISLNSDEFGLIFFTILMHSFEVGDLIVLWEKVVYNISKWDKVVNKFFIKLSLISQRYYAYRRIQTHTR